jgi:ubiquinone/menaquinone biosynthesis C-methylase UbiE
VSIHDFYDAINPYFRRRRMRRFAASLHPGPETTLLDIGGRTQTWTVEFPQQQDFPVIMLNLRYSEKAPLAPRFKAIEANALHIPFADKSFDIAFSNSVIEHVGSWEDQKQFASEVSRVGRKLWIQTPARSFPIEPHYVALFMHYLPKRLQRRLIRWFSLRGYMERLKQAEIDEMVDEIRLLSYREMKQLFPDCTILRERTLGLTKSYVAIRT